jgi:hypothetical protein
MIGMPTGLKASSSIVSIGFEATETTLNTFVQNQIDLNLSPLDREVFVVLAINMDPFSPDLDATAAYTAVTSSLTTTSQTAVQQLSNSNCLAHGSRVIRGDDPGFVAFESQIGETPPSTLDYIGIIATNDFFVQCQGVGNKEVKAVHGKLYGYRAIANADVFAALVQSEVLSA